MTTYSFLSDKNILITGITGFIGTHLAKRLISLNANVFGTSRTLQKNNIYRIDIQDFNALNSFIKDKKIDICFHLAGESLVEAGQLRPYDTFQSNISGTLNIIKSSRINNLKKIIISSSSHVYGDQVPPCTEDDFPKPSRPYETSKLCTDLISQSYANTFDLPILIPRFVNIYGPGDQNFNRLIPSTMKSVVLNKNPKMWGGKIVRDYLYIDDAINGFLSLACYTSNEKKKNIIFNFGANNKKSVEEIISLVIKTSKKDLKIVNNNPKRKAEILAQYLSWDKAQQKLNWYPKVSLEKGMNNAYHWYNKNLKLL